MTKEKRHKSIREEGQATVEFLLTFAFSFSLIFIFLSLALNYAEGYVIHYANFMASRAYLVHDANASSAASGAYAANDQVAATHAKSVLTQTYPALDSGNMTIRAPSANLGGHQNLYTGTYYQFEQNFALPFSATGGKALNMRSESFLGREPTRDACLQRVCRAMNIKLGVGFCDKHMTLSDNGC